MEYTGGCRCGAVRYVVTAEPLAARICWCRDCQYFAAGSGTVNAFFPVAAVQLSGPLRDFASTADSGNRMHRQFCERCGTPVTTAAESRPEVIGLRAGTLDDPNTIRPASVIWTDSAPTWACIDPALPSSPGQPPPAG